MSFWDNREPCWKITNCPEENRRKCGAYIAQYYPCWELPLEDRCPIADKVESCEECPVYKINLASYQEEKRSESGSIKVLLADDEMLIRWSLYQTLRRAGYNVTIASDGNKTIEEIKTTNFNFVLIDMRMPGMDGFSIAEEVKRCSPKSRVILMTAFGSEEIEKRAFEMGIMYLPKPLDLDKIMEILNCSDDSSSTFTPKL